MTKKIKLPKGKVALVDDDDYGCQNQYKWQYHHKGYAMRRESGQRRALLLHREVMKARTGQEIDHVNGDGLDNRKSNLRFCTKSQNGMNRKKQANTSSQYKGVYWDKENKKWRAIIMLNNKWIHLGRFNSEKEAAIAYNNKAIELFKEFCCLNEVVL